MDKRKKKRFGLIGKNISYSFSRGYFAKKFKALGLNHHSYENFDLGDISEFEKLIATHRDLRGLNVTIPYKEKIIPFLDKIDDIALQIGAVNTIKVTDDELMGFNTDAIGFEKSLVPHLRPCHSKGLILGTGGASKAIAHVLGKLDIDFLFVSRNPDKGQLGYKDLTEELIRERNVIVNCTPLGTYPDVEKLPELPYGFMGKQHLLYDLIYNPEKTSFLKHGEARGASIVNGQKMLELQAEAAWNIWNS